MALDAQTVADIVEIEQLAATYSDRISRKLVTEALQVYAPDGVLRTPTTAEAHGHEAIRAVIEGGIADLEFLFNVVYGGMVAVHGDTAKARFPITEWARRASDGRGILFIGYYDDEVVRTDDGWRFSARRLIPRTLGRPDFLTGRVLELEGLNPAL
jgi:hypothetical protein